MPDADRSRAAPSSLTHSDSFAAKLLARASAAWEQSPALRIAVHLALTGALIAYLVWFAVTPLPGLPEVSGRPVQRALDWLPLVVAPEKLVGAWFGEGGRVAVLDRLPVLAIALGMWALAGAAGWLVLRGLGAAGLLTRLERAVFSLGVGMSLISLYTLLVGLAGLLTARVTYLIPGAVVLVAAGALWVFKRREPAAELPTFEEQTETAPAAPASRRSARAKAPPPPRAPDAALPTRRWLAAIVPFALVMVLGAMLPPVDFDARQYHLQVPKEWYQAGRVTFLPHNVYGNMPLGAEMPTVMAMALAGDWWLGALAGKTVMAGWALLGAAGVYAAAVRFLSRRIAVVAAIVYLSTPWIVLSAMNGLPEGAYAAYLLLAGFALALWRAAGMAGTERTWPFVALAGFLAGSAVACKYSALLFVVVPLVLILFGAARGSVLKAGAIFLIAMVIACGPWLVKNWVLAGNPVYPHLFAVFGGNSRTAGHDQQWTMAHRAGLKNLSALGASLAAIAGKSEWLSPLLMPLVLLAPLARRWRYAALVLLGFLAFYFAEWWIWTTRVDRTLLPMLPVAALAAGIGAAWSASRLWQLVLYGLLIVGLVMNFVTITSGVGADPRLFVSLTRLRDDPARTDPWHRWFNENVPPGKRVLLVGDAQPFDLRVPVLYSTAFDESALERWARGAPPEELHRRLVEADVSHVYVHWPEIFRYRVVSKQGFSLAITPSFFRELVASGVLEPALPRIEGSYGEVYPVAKEFSPEEAAREEAAQEAGVPEQAASEHSNGDALPQGDPSADKIGR